jgi:hypothetical protein
MTDQRGDMGEAHRISMELDLVMSAIGCSVRKAITRLQHEQLCAHGVSYSATHEQHEENVAMLQQSLQSALATMQELSNNIEQTLRE